MTTIVGSGHVIGALQMNLLTVKVSNSMSRFMKICFTVDGNNNTRTKGHRLAIRHKVFSL